MELRRPNISGMDVHKEAIVIAVLECRREAGNGVRHRNQSQQHSASSSTVYGGAGM